jgi:hypothetical protein
VDIVYPTLNGMVAWSQGETYLSRTRGVATDHPLVKERPDLFVSEPPRPAGARIERATRAPGERRGGRPRRDAE